MRFSIRIISPSSASARNRFDELPYFSRLLISSCVSSSEPDPYANVRKFLVSLPRRRLPSAIFEGIETAHLRICEVSPYCSSFGNSRVYSYRTVTRSMLFCQTIRSRYCAMTTFYELLSTNYPSALQRCSAMRSAGRVISAPLSRFFIVYFPESRSFSPTTMMNGTPSFDAAFIWSPARFPE